MSQGYRKQNRGICVEGDGSGVQETEQGDCVQRRHETRKRTGELRTGRRVMRQNE